MKRLMLCTSLILSGCVSGLKSGIPDYMVIYNAELQVNGLNSPQDRVGAELYHYIKRYIKSSDTAPKHRLEVQYSTFEDKYAIQTNSIATRKKASINMYYKLINLDKSVVISQGAIKRSGSYYIEDSTYSTYVAQEDELRNLTYAVVDEMLTEIAIKYQR